MIEILLKVGKIVVCLLVIKVIIGLHWNWEKCDCCGKTWREIRKEKKEVNKK